MNKLLKILKTYNSEITTDMNKKLVSDGVIDSVDLVSLISDLEEEFNISISMEDIVESNFDSVESMWNMIQKLQKK